MALTGSKFAFVIRDGVHDRLPGKDDKVIITSNTLPDITAATTTNPTDELFEEVFSAEERLLGNCKIIVNVCKYKNASTPKRIVILTSEYSRDDQSAVIIGNTLRDLCSSDTGDTVDTVDTIDIGYMTYSHDTTHFPVDEDVGTIRIYVADGYTMSKSFNGAGRIEIISVPAFATVAIFHPGNLFFDKDIITLGYVSEFTTKATTGITTKAKTKAKTKVDVVATFVMRHGHRNDTMVQDPNPSILCTSDIVNTVGCGIVDVATIGKTSLETSLETPSEIQLKSRVPYEHALFVEEIRNLVPWFVASGIPIRILTSPMLRTIQTGAVLYKVLTDEIRHFVQINPSEQSVEVISPTIVTGFHEVGHKVTDVNAGRPYTVLDDAGNNFVIKSEDMQCAERRFRKQCDLVTDQGPDLQMHTFIVGHGDMVSTCGDDHLKRTLTEELMIYAVPELSIIGTTVRCCDKTKEMYFSDRINEGYLPKEIKRLAVLATSD